MQTSWEKQKQKKHTYHFRIRCIPGKWTRSGQLGVKTPSVLFEGWQGLSVKMPSDFPRPLHFCEHCRSSSIHQITSDVPTCPRLLTPSCPPASHSLIPHSVCIPDLFYQSGWIVGVACLCFPTSSTWTWTWGRCHAKTAAPWMSTWCWCQKLIKAIDSTLKCPFLQHKINMK